MPIPIARLLNSAHERSNLTFLREGTVPTLADRKLVYEDLDNLEAELRRVDDEIARPQALREQIETQLALSRAMVAPVRRLPSELLARTFLEHVDEYPDAERTSYATTTLAKVSATWRWVACSVPGLWTHITLTSIEGSVYPRLEVCLSRSGFCLLHIHAEHATGIALKAQITRLLPDAHRWKTLSLHHHYNTMLPDVLTCSLPSLERAALCMAMMRLGTPGQIPFVLDFLADAPRLHDLTLTAHATYDIPEDYKLTIPTSCSLTALSLKNFSCEVRSVLPLIRQCAGTLQHLSLLFNAHNSLEFRLGQCIEMPRLKSINIGASTCRFLYDLRMPHLESITTESTMDAFISLLHFLSEGGGYPHIIRDLHLLHFHSNSLCYSNTNEQVLQRLLDLLRRLEHLRTLAVDISSGTHMHLDEQKSSLAWS